MHDRVLCQQIALIEKESGLAGLILRPLSAQNFPPTIPELAAEFDAIPRQERDAMFNADGIHANDDGNKAIAAGILGCLENQGLLDALIE